MGRKALHNSHVLQEASKYLATGDLGTFQSILDRNPAEVYLDAPFNEHIEQLIAIWPAAKFIYTDRSLEKWKRSAVIHEAYKYVSGHIPEVELSSKQLEDRYERYYQEAARISQAGIPMLWLNCVEPEEPFGQDRWNRLARFLEVDVDVTGWVWPHLNTSVQRLNRMRTRV